MRSHRAAPEASAIGPYWTQSLVEREAVRGERFAHAGAALARAVVALVSAR